MQTLSVTSLVWAGVFMLSACGGGGSGEGRTPMATAVTGASVLAIATQLFEEKALSASGLQSCASCHVTANGHADPTGTRLPIGGAALDAQGHRSSPTLHYLDANGPFQFVAGEPVGGFTWDGRADTRADQSLGPLFDGAEMANQDVPSLADKVRALPYYADVAALFGLSSQSTDQAVVLALQQALETYQRLDTDYSLFNSRYDRYLDGAESLSAAELRGLQIFNDPLRGHCAKCHPSQPSVDGTRPLFTTFGYEALGVPRNPDVIANADPTYYDMGLCGPKRTDLTHRTDLCGRFKIPTLRNIAVTAPYFHNAAVATLDLAVAFYATRDTDPLRWYPIVNGVIDRFNDLPEALRGNVLRDAPFGQRPGDAPRLGPADVADLVAFLRTLTDDATRPPGGARVGGR